jgi:uracil-DNA glycosylase
MMTREDTNYLTREDVLRELELLPAWKLRAPIQVAQITETQKAEVSLMIEEPQVIEAPQVAATEQAALFEITLSQDKHWAFVCKNAMPVDRMDIASQGTLLNNILQALHIEKPSKMQAANIANVDAKIIVAMGESVAQTLLNSQDTLENLRGKLHTIGTAKLIASDDLAHLLANPQHKAKLWQDLCLARDHIKSLD